MLLLCFTLRKPCAHKPGLVRTKACANLVRKPCARGLCGALCAIMLVVRWLCPAALCTQACGHLGLESILGLQLGRLGPSCFTGVRSLQDIPCLATACLVWSVPKGGSAGACEGRRGVHSEHLGYILAELQYMQRAYPGMEW